MKMAPKKPGEKMFHVVETIDENTGRRAVDLRIDPRADPEEVEAARQALPAAVADQMMPTETVCSVLETLCNLPIPSRIPPAYTHRFLYPQDAS